MKKAKPVKKKRGGISGKPHITCRASVKWFAKEMEAKLAENDSKGGWINCRLDYLIDRLKEETGELVLELLKSDRWKEQHPSFKQVIVREAADIANFALMIADLHAHRHGR